MLCAYMGVGRSSTRGRKKVSSVVFRDCSRAKRKRRLSMGTSAGMRAVRPRLLGCEQTQVVPVPGVWGGGRSIGWGGHRSTGAGAFQGDWEDPTGDFIPETHRCSV